MNVFVIPSWYPSAVFPSTGIFFKEQAILFARHIPDSKVGICLWGSHEPKLWLKVSKPLDALLKSGSKFPLKKSDVILETNCVSFFTPAFTWSRKWRNGNIDGIVKSCEENFERHSEYFGKPDVIHAHVAYPGGWIAQKLAEKFEIPFVITEHMSPFPMPSFHKDYHKFVLPPLRNASKVLVVSKALGRQLSAHGISSENVSNFIDDSIFKPAEEKNQEGLNIIAVGRLEPQKNYEDLLTALAYLKGRQIDFTMTVIGAGSEDKFLKQKAEKMELSQIRWLGECDRDQVLSALQNANVFVNTSIHENQPVSILEAMACGLTVVSYDWKGAEEVVNDEVGYVIPSNPKSLADQLEKLAGGLRVSSREIRKYYEAHYGAQRICQQLKGIYEQLIDQSA